jgi:hypothetical protein
MEIKKMSENNLKLEAEKTLEDQRKKGAKGEEAYWLTLKEGARTAKTSIQVTRGLKAALDELKLTPRESYQGVIERLIKVNSEKQVETLLEESK